MYVVLYPTIALLNVSHFCHSLQDAIVHGVLAVAAFAGAVAMASYVGGDWRDLRDALDDDNPIIRRAQDAVSEVITSGEAVAVS